MKGEKKIQKREFLNKDNALTAFYMLDIGYDTFKHFNDAFNNKRNRRLTLSFDGELKIADCSKIINLDFLCFGPNLSGNKVKNKKEINETLKDIRGKRAKAQKLKAALELLDNALDEYEDVINSINVDEVSRTLKEREDKHDAEGKD